MSHTEPKKKLSEQDIEAPPEPRPESLPHGTTSDQIAEMESEGQAQEPAKDLEVETPNQNDREGATDKDVGDLTGPGAGYDMEPEQEKDRGGVA